MENAFRNCGPGGHQRNRSFPSADFGIQFERPNQCVHGKGRAETVANNENLVIRAVAGAICNSPCKLLQAFIDVVTSAVDVRQRKIPIVERLMKLPSGPAQRQKEQRNSACRCQRNLRKRRQLEPESQSRRETQCQAENQQKIKQGQDRKTEIAQIDRCVTAHRSRDDQVDIAEDSATKLGKLRPCGVPLNEIVQASSSNSVTARQFGPDVSTFQVANPAAAFASETSASTFHVRLKKPSWRMKRV